MNFKLWFRLLVVATSVVTTLHVAPATSAAPNTPQGGVLTVNTTVDSAILPDTLSLREAILVANGIKIGPFSAGEQALMPGCTFSSGNIVGGCGGGITDTIQFAGSLGTNPILTIDSVLPSVNDTVGTIIDGSVNSVRPIINAQNGGLSNDGLRIASNSNSVYSIIIINAPRDGIRITGNNNRLDFYVSVRSSTRHGIMIDGGDNNVVMRIDVGADGYSETCAGNGETGVVLANGAVNNTIQDTLVGCNRNGISIQGSNNNRIGPYVYVGTTTSGTVLSNTLTGISISAGATSNQVLTSTVSRNLTGVVINGAGSNNNIVRGNRIFNNSGTGIEVSGGAQLNIIGGTFGSGYTRGNLISLNTTGILISDTTTAFTFVYGNRIGTSSDGMAMAGNLLGISILKASSNFIGATQTERNLISGNTNGGIYIRGGKSNLIQGNYIGTNQSGAEALPNQYGILMFDGAQYNTVGGDTLSNLNVIAGNNSDGIRIFNNTTTSNTIVLNDIGLNTYASGVPLATTKRIRASTVVLPNQTNGIFLLGAHQNVIGPGNYVAHNVLHGIYLAGASQENTISTNSVFSNKGHGIMLKDTDTVLNVITRTAIYQNDLNGIAETSGAGANTWREVSIYDNGGLGINQDTVNPLANTPNPPANFRITSVNQTTGNVSGKANGSLLLVFTFVDLYRIALDPSGYGEGESFVGSAVTDVNGNWTIIDPSPSLSKGCYTAVVRGLVIVAPYASEFARSNCSQFVPSVRR